MLWILQKNMDSQIQICAQPSCVRIQPYKYHIYRIDPIKLVIFEIGDAFGNFFKSFMIPFMVMAFLKGL